MSRILILKTGHTDPKVRALHGDYDRWFIDAMPRPGLSFEVSDVTREQPPAPDGFAGVIVTGSVSAAYHDEPWMPGLSAYLSSAGADGPPTLCVCFGAQMLAQARGGQVVRNPEGWEIGSVDVELSAAALDDPLMAGLPRVFKALATHEDRIERLPPGAELLASNAGTPVQAFRAAEKLWGVQFHPEATPPIICELIALRGEHLERDARRRGGPGGGHVARLLASLSQPDAGQGRRVLDNFVRICQGG